MATAHWNSCYIIDDYGLIESIVYNGQKDITHGQPIEEEPSISRDGATIHMQVKCGRKKSSGPADTFNNDWAGGKYHETTNGNTVYSPEELNFVFGFEVVLRVDEQRVNVTIYLAQGNYSTVNNWWIGCRSIASVSGNQSYIPILNAAGVLIELISVSFSNDETVQIGRTMRIGDLLPDQSAWLSPIPGDRSIGSISLPGTHDSASIVRRFPGLLDPWVRHATTLTQQLIRGIRVLDLRIAVTKKDGQWQLDTCHGDTGYPFNLFQSLHSAMQEIADFLSENDREFVVLSLKIDYLADDVSRDDAINHLRTYFNTDWSRWFYLDTDNTRPEVPLLRDVRGLIYRLNRIDSTYDFGIPLVFDDNTTGQTIDFGTPTSFSLYIQDHFETFGPGDPTQQKLNDYLAAQQAALATNATILVNFATAVIGPANLSIIDIIGLLLNTLGSTVGTTRMSSLGWSLFDFETATYTTNVYQYINMVDLIIDSNFAYQTYPKIFTAAGIAATD